MSRMDVQYVEGASAAEGFGVVSMKEGRSMCWQVVLTTGETHQSTGRSARSLGYALRKGAKWDRDPLQVGFRYGKRRASRRGCKYHIKRTKTYAQHNPACCTLHTRYINKRVALCSCTVPIYSTHTYNNHFSATGSLGARGFDRPCRITPQ